MKYTLKNKEKSAYPYSKDLTHLNRIPGIAVKRHSLNKKSTLSMTMTSAVYEKYRLLFEDKSLESLITFKVSLYRWKLQVAVHHKSYSSGEFYTVFGHCGDSTFGVFGNNFGNLRAAFSCYSQFLDNLESRYGQIKSATFNF